MTGAFAAALSSASSGDASPASAPETTTAPAETSAPAAIEQAAPATSEPESVSPETEPAKPGEPPRWRWQDILANARETSAREAEQRVRQELEQQYSAAQPFVGMSQEEVQGLQIWRAALAGHPQALQMIRSNPQVMQRLQGWFSPEPVDVEPQADLQTADGTPVYSAAKQAEREAWLTKQIKQQLAQEFAPLQEVVQTQQQYRQFVQQQEHMQRWAADALMPVSRMPHFQETKPAIIEALRNAPPNASAQQLRELVYDTYAHALTARNQQSESQVLTNLQQRAVAGTVNPSAAGAATPRKFAANAGGFAAALEHFAGGGSR